MPFPTAIAPALETYVHARNLRLKKIETYLKRGLVLQDPFSLDLRGSIRFAPGVSIDANVIIIGKVTLAEGVKIGPNCILEDCRIGANTTVREFTCVGGSTIGGGSRIGPYARIRPGCRIGINSQIGNFVEMKTTRTGEFCRINHHSFIGDCQIGKNVTIGAGAITCNYDGEKSNPSVIKDNAFVGSGVMLIAPIVVEKNAFVAAGSTVSRTAPADGLTITRAQQRTIENWSLKRKKK